MSQCVRVVCRRVFSRASRSEIVGFSEGLARFLAGPRADGANCAGVPNVRDGLLPVVAPLKFSLFPGVSFRDSGVRSELGRALGFEDLIKGH